MLERKNVDSIYNASNNNFSSYKILKFCFTITDILLWIFPFRYDDLIENSKRFFSLREETLKKIVFIAHFWEVFSALFLSCRLRVLKLTRTNWIREWMLLLNIWSNFDTILNWNRTIFFCQNVTPIIDEKISLQKIVQKNLIIEFSMILSSRQYNRKYCKY